MWRARTQTARVRTAMTSPVEPSTDGAQARATRDGHADRAAVHADDLSVELAGLRRRLDTMPVIEQSKGILIANYGIDADTAFLLLRRWSSHSNLKLRDISRLIVDTASQSSSRPHQLAELLRRLDTAPKSLDGHCRDRTAQPRIIARP